ncbi:transcriptional regulator, Crp/Fnr family [Candidatus Magnetoovum chiemensis]|nr:transcriptional regulator, Crp/Fnr family [Candidatus Magnetoovum chiemensis]
MNEFAIRRFSPNEIIFTEGSTGNCAYIIKKGVVEISVLITNIKVVLHKLEPVTIFGETALLLDDNRRTATAKAIMYSELIEISKSVFDEYLQQAPQIIETTLKALVNRLKKTTLMVSKPVDIFLSTCEMLNLIAYYETKEISYNLIVQSLSNMVLIEKAKIEQTLELLRALQLINIEIREKGKKTIAIVDKDNFLKNALNIHRNLYDIY